MITTKKKYKRSFTLKGQCFFLTIPRIEQTEITKQLVEELLKKEENDFSQYVISIEKHQNVRTKGLHLHIWLRYSKRKEFGLKHFDYLGKHGKLEKVRSSDNVLKYISKEDPQPLANIDLHLTKLQKNFHNTVMKMIQNGFTFSQIVVMYKEKLAYKPWNKIERFINMANESERIEKLRTLHHCPLRLIGQAIIKKRLNQAEYKLFNSFPGYQTLVDILNKIFQLRYNQKHKDCCVSIVGQTSIGKTYLIRELSKYVPIYNYPEDGWHKQYQNNTFSAIFWNEWKFSIHDKEDYLRLMEGDPIDLKIKGSKGHKSDRPFIILVSNEQYVEKVRRRFRLDKNLFNIYCDALKTRIVEIDFEDRDLTFLTKLFVRTTEDI